MFDRLEVFEKKYEECNQKLYDPAVVSDPEAVSYTHLTLPTN